MPLTKAQKIRRRERRNPEPGNAFHMKGKGKGKGKAAGKGKGKGKAPKPAAGKTYSGLYEPGEILRGPALKKAVSQSVNQQVNPALRAIHGLVKNLTTERNYEEDRAQNFGNQAAFNTKSYYDDLAKKEADLIRQRDGVGAALSGVVSQSGKAAQTAIGTSGAAAQGSIGQNTTGQDIGARDRLTQMIAEASSNAARENQIIAGQTTASSKAGSDLLAAMAGAAQMRGGEQLGEQQGFTRNAKEKIRNQYASSIGKGRSAALELLQQKPELFRKAITELRGSEREQENARAALGIERAGLSIKKAETKSGINYANVSAKNNLELAKLKHEYRMEELDEQGASSAQKQAEKESWRKEEIKLLEASYGKGGGKGGGKGKEGYKEYSGAKAYFDSFHLPPKILAQGDPKSGKTGKQIRKDAYSKLRNNGISDAYAKRLIKTAIRNWKKQNRKKVGSNFPSSFGG